MISRDDLTPYKALSVLYCAAVSVESANNPDVPSVKQWVYPCGVSRETFLSCYD